MDVVYLAGPGMGSFVLELNGAAVQTINASAAQTTYGQVATIAGLTPGTYTLRIIAQGTTAIDAISVDGQIIAAAPTGGVIVAPATPEVPTVVPIEPTPETPTVALPEPTPEVTPESGGN